MLWNTSFKIRNLQVSSGGGGSGGYAPPAPYPWIRSWYKKTIIRQTTTKNNNYEAKLRKLSDWFLPFAAETNYFLSTPQQITNKLETK